MGVEPIRKVSVVEQAIEKIYELIQSRDLKQNDRLPPERQLSEMLGISRNSLREAIRVLDMLGILRVDQGRGMVIDSSRVSESVTRHLSFALLLNREKLEELFEARLVLETECASLAAERASQAELDDLVAALADLDGCRADRPRGIVCELRLHDLVAKAAHNSVIEKILDSLKRILRESRETTVPSTGVTQTTVDSQHKIVDAIRARDATRARAEMSAHIRAVATRARAAAEVIAALEAKDSEQSA